MSGEVQRGGPTLTKRQIRLAQEAFRLDHEEQQQHSPNSAPAIPSVSQQTQKES